jgi:hypothetical protein
MQSKVRGAFYAWLAAVIIGIIPLVAHAIAIGSSVPAAGTRADWTADLLFIVIATSGTSSVSVVTRLLKGEVNPERLDMSASVLSAVTVLILVGAATLYGSAAVGHARSWASWEALGLLACSLLTSIYYELMLASKLAA